MKNRKWCASCCNFKALFLFIFSTKMVKIYHIFPSRSRGTVQDFEKGEGVPAYPNAKPSTRSEESAKRGRKKIALGDASRDTVSPLKINNQQVTFIAQSIEQMNSSSVMIFSKKPLRVCFIDFDQ